MSGRNDGNEGSKIGSRHRKYIGGSDRASLGIQHWSKDINNVKENVGENSVTGRGKGK